MTNLLETAAASMAAEWHRTWNAPDMSRMAAPLTRDVDFVNVLGSHWKAKPKSNAFTLRHSTQFRDSVWDNHELQAQLRQPGIGLVHLRWSIRGDFDPDGTPRRPRSGRFSWLLLRDGDHCRIRAAQNTNIVKPPSA